MGVRAVIEFALRPLVPHEPGGRVVESQVRDRVQRLRESVEIPDVRGRQLGRQEFGVDRRFVGTDKQRNTRAGLCRRLGDLHKERAHLFNLVGRGRAGKSQLGHRPVIAVAEEQPVVTPLEPPAGRADPVFQTVPQVHRPGGVAVAEIGPADREACQSDCHHDRGEAQRTRRFAEFSKADRPLDQAIGQPCQQDGQKHARNPRIPVRHVVLCNVQE